MNTNSLKKTARWAGLWYLMLVVVAPFGLMYVPSQVMVRGDTAATVQNILDNEFLFRSGIVGNLIGEVIFVLLVFALYRLLRRVNGHHAKLMAALVIVAVPVAFLGNVFKITALMVLKGGILASLGSGEASDIAMVLLKTAGYGEQIVQLYWGLWLIPFGWLVYKSGFIPRIFGVLLVLNGIGYIILSFTFVLIPEYQDVVLKFAMPFLFLGELPIMLWLLIKGVKSNQNSERSEEIFIT